MSSRRIVAAILPDLLIELSGAGPAPQSALADRARGPSAVVVMETPDAVLDIKTRLDAVNSTARKLGIYPRQTLGEAQLRVERLNVRAVPRQRVIDALKQVAEVALGVGSPVSFQALDTVWVDITGSSHLFESEHALALELIAQIRSLGYSARVAISSGPWLSRAFARYGRVGYESVDVSIVGAEHTVREVENLPIIALPITPDAAAWFSRLGLLTIGDLRKLPTSSLAARLADCAEACASSELARGFEPGAILDLIRGHDPGVLIPYQPEPMPVEELIWDEPSSSVEPLLFVSKSLSHRLCARLEGRGEAVRELQLVIHHDPAIVRLNTAAGSSAEVASMDGVSTGSASKGSTSTHRLARSDLGLAGPVAPTDYCKTITFRFPTPIARADELERVLRARLQREVLDAPAVGLSLKASGVTRARACQLDIHASMGSKSGLSSEPQAMSRLVSELAADLGSSAVGLLQVNSSHLLEKSTSLVEFRCAREGAGRLEWASPELLIPTRILQVPIGVDVPLRKRELLMLGARAYLVSEIRFEQRIEAVEWWEAPRIFRDYYRIWLSAVNGGSTREGLEALVYRDREDGQTYVQAVYD